MRHAMAHCLGTLLQLRPMRSLCTMVPYAVLVASMLPSARGASPGVKGDAEAFFEAQVRPVLAEHCFRCHGAEKQESGLRLDSRAAVLAGADGGVPIVETGKPESSRLVQAVARKADIKMPPDEELEPSQVAALAEWVRMGLPWSEEVGVLESRQPERPHWAYQPVVQPQVPASNTDHWSCTPLDAFVNRKLAQSGLAPSPAADRWTLRRRLSFDLVGLPPTYDEAESFLGDSSPDAASRLVDRLLASPAYGERWGRHWLDVARYGDTRGYAFGGERRYPYAFTYRDYVADAWNRDLPFDSFLLEQLAADRLPEARDKSSLAALGFLTVGRRFNNPHEDIDELIDVVTRGLMGMTVACARCHDHKYDPITMEDYYGLYGVFASCREPGALPLLCNPDDDPRYERFAAEHTRRREAIDRFLAEKHAELLDVSRKHVTDYLVRAISPLPEAELQKLPLIALRGEQIKPRLIERWKRFLEDRAVDSDPILGPWYHLARLDDAGFAEWAGGLVKQWAADPGSVYHPLVRQALADRPPQSRIDVAALYGRLLETAYGQWHEAGADSAGRARLPGDVQSLVGLLLDPGTPTDIPLGEIASYLSVKEGNEQRKLRRELESFEVDSPDAPPRAMVVADVDSPQDAHVLLRGDPARRGSPVPRRFPAFLSQVRAEPFRDGSGRLELAQAVVSPQNPLTPRVLVNRVWMHHFGEPLVATPSDFGVRSDTPTHPLLLDYLAQRFMRDGWSIKRLHRQIVLSSTYGQTSADRADARYIDPENRLLWRMNRRRLEFEALRDSLLVAAGRLDRQIGGKPFDLMRLPAVPRRSIYALIDRQDLPGLLRTFDFASPDQSVPRRPNTTVPGQSLFLMNSAFVMDQAEALAGMIDGLNGMSRGEKIRACYERLFAREPAAEESAVGEQFLQAVTEHAPPSLKYGTWQQYAQILLMTHEFSMVD